jgi:hypothetical protein
MLRLCLLLTSAIAVAMPTLASDAESDAWRQAHREWQAARLERLLEPDGWLTLTGLHWLSADKQQWQIGSAAENDIVLNGGPDRLALLTRDGETIWLSEQYAEPEVPINRPVPRQWYGPDGDNERLVFGGWQLELILRDGTFGLRERDSQASTRTEFLGIEAFPPRGQYRVQAEYIPFDEPQQRVIPTVAGVNDIITSPGQLRFEMQGQSIEIEVYRFDGDDELFIVFADRTNGELTYGGGRFVYTALPDEQQKVLIDFNRAYNPPCVFTPYSTCPLPPRSNRLDLRIEAGELLPAKAEAVTKG